MCVVWTENVLFSTPIAWGEQSETMKTAVQFHHKTHWLMIMYYQTKFDNKRISSSEDIVETVMIIWILDVTLTLRMANQPFCMTLWLMMMHHNTKFGNKMFVSLEDIIWTNTDILTFTLTLTLRAVIQFFKRHSGLWWCIIRPSFVAKESTVQKIW